jgi:flagellar assembly factor FliW
VMAICRFRAGHQPTANLRSPLVFNRQTRHGGQFVHGQWPAALEEAPLALVQEAAPCSS